jgi:hypothetical protein
MSALLSEPGPEQMRAAKYCLGGNGHASSKFASAAVTNPHFPWKLSAGNHVISPHVVTNLLVTK